MSVPPSFYDLDVRLLVAAQSVASAAIDPFALFLSGPWLWVLLALGLLAVGFRHRRGQLLRLGLVTLATVGVTDLACSSIKRAVHRPRPCHYITVRLPEGHCGGYQSFPSNHAANGMALVVILLLLRARLAALCVLPIVLAVGYSRVYLGVHFPGDVLAGFLLGALLAVLTGTAFRGQATKAPVVRT